MSRGKSGHFPLAMFLSAPGNRGHSRLYDRSFLGRLCQMFELTQLILGQSLEWGRTCAGAALCLCAELVFTEMLL